MKNNEQLLNIIGEINEKYISKKNVKRKKAPALKITAGVSVCAAAVAGFLLLQSTVERWDKYPVFPNSGYESYMFIDGTEGGEPLYAHDKIFCRISKYKLYGGVDIPDIVQAQSIGKLDPSNPWNEDTELDTLPIFKNLSYSDSSEVPARYFSDVEMTVMAENAAKGLGVSITGSEFAEVGNEDEGVQCQYVLKADCEAKKYGLDGIRVNVYSDGIVEIDFDPNKNGSGIPLPEGYMFDGGSPAFDMSADFMLQDIYEKFRNVLQIEKPTMTEHTETQEITDGKIYDRNVFRMYEDGADAVVNILNYGLNFADFSGTGNILKKITLTNRLAVSGYVANYPVITVKEAQKLLLNGIYTTNVDDKLIRQEDVKLVDVDSVELIYRGDSSKYYIPYYRFYARLKKSDYLEDMGFNVYGAFYVPAVELKYLNMGYTLPDMTGEMLEAYPNDKVKLPSGLEVDKTEAYRAYEWDGEPMLEFNFAFLRSPNRFYQNTIDDPYCFDFETMTFNEDHSMGRDEIGYVMLKKGDVINGMTVTEAKIRVAWDKETGSEKYIFNIVELNCDDGFVPAEGILRYFPENGDYAAEGDLCFYPSPISDYPLFVSVDERIIFFTDGNTALRSDGGVISAGNVSDRNDGFDAEEIFKNGNCVKAKLYITALRYEDYAEENSGTCADFSGWEIL